MTTEEKKLYSMITIGVGIASILIVFIANIILN